MRNRSIASTLVVAASIAGLAAGCGGGGPDTGKKAGGSTTPTTIAQGHFTPVGQLATGRTAHTATWISTTQKVLVVGGRARVGSTDIVLDSAELFDPASGQFTPTQGRLSGARTAGQNGRMSHAAVALPTGRVVIIGGQTDPAGTSVLNSLEVFDPNSTSAQFGTVSGNLTEGKSDPVVFSYNSATSGTPEIVIAGGRKSGNVALLSVNYYKADSNSIVSQTAQLRTARYGGRALPMSSAANAEWVIAGGKGAAGAVGFEVYDPVAKVFKATSAQAPSSTNSSLFANRLAFDAAILGAAPAILGGSSGTSALDTVEFYDPATNNWTAVTVRLTTPRQGHTVTKLASGDILVIGGMSAGGQVLGSVELVSGSGVGASVSTLSAALSTPRKNHTATLMTMTINGQAVEGILIAGGEDASGNPVASAEVFVPANVNPPVVTPPGGNGQAPTIISLTPNQGPIGTAVTVKGMNLSTTPTQNIVKFAGVVTPVQSAVTSSTTAGAVELRVLVPQGAQTGDVTAAVGGITSNGMPFTVGTSTGTGTGTGGTVFSGPPRIFILLPSSGPAFMPIGIGGTNFDVGTIPYVTAIPSISLFNFSTQSLPLIGAISVGFTIVPPAAPSGPGDVTVDYFGQRSNPFPFTVN